MRRTKTTTTTKPKSRTQNVTGTVNIEVDKKYVLYTLNMSSTEQKNPSVIQVMPWYAVKPEQQLTHRKNRIHIFIHDIQQLHDADMEKLLNHGTVL